VKAVVARYDVEEVQASELSMMPEGIPIILGPDRMRDLMTFLIVPPLPGARLENLGPISGGSPAAD
jgi:hypothetical protein